MDAFIPLGLVGLIYDSINNPEAQQEFFVKFAARLHASSAFGFICSPDGKQRHVRAAVGMDSKWWPLFNEYYIHLDPYWLGGTMRSRYPLGIPKIGEQCIWRSTTTSCALRIISIPQVYEPGKTLLWSWLVHSGLALLIQRKWNCSGI